jgi:WD40 repeat protein
LAAGYENSTIIIWKDNTLTTNTKLNGHEKKVKSLALIANDILASGSCDSTIKIWNLIDSSLMKTLTGHSRGVVCLEQFTNGYLISGANDNSIKGIFKSFLKIKPISRDLFVNKDLSTISNEINTLSH